MENSSHSEAQLALDFIEQTGKNLFLTGRAGTGKTTFLRKLRKISSKRMIVVAPTGVAAINAEGVTIHSFFSLPLAPFIPLEFGKTNEQQKYKLRKVKIEIIRGLDLLVIDEISMVRADILDAIDHTLRKYRHNTQPFGGVQLLLIGDMQQLPPVVTDDDLKVLSPYYKNFYFFNSYALQKTDFLTIELTHVFRQQERVFIDLLNAIRENRIGENEYKLLQSRVNLGFQSDDYIMLTTHNYQSQRINEQRLQSINKPTKTYEAEIDGDFPSSSYPTDLMLQLKVGAKVMFLKNDTTEDKRFYNGKIAVVETLEENTILVRDNDSHLISVEMMTWENMQYSVEEKTKEIIENKIGSFTQFPLKLAWSITIHKSQGLTFDKVIIDGANAFAHGQVYVALSRCRTLEGLILSSKITNDCLKIDQTIDNFLTHQEQNKPNETVLNHFRFKYGQQLLKEMFDFAHLLKYFQRVNYFVKENQKVIKGNLGQIAPKAQIFVQEKLVDISKKFVQQIDKILYSNPIIEKNDLLDERVKKANHYFAEQLTLLENEYFSNISYNIENKAIVTKIEELLQQINIEVKVLKAGNNSAIEGFNIIRFLAARSKAKMSDAVEVKKSRKRTRKDFLDEVYNEANKQNNTKSNKTSSLSSIEQTKLLLDACKTLEEIANLRSLTVATIEGHIADLAKIGEINIEKIFPEEVIENVRNYFKNSDDLSLKPAFQHFEERLSYNVLRIIKNHFIYSKEIAEPIKGINDK